VAKRRGVRIVITLIVIAGVISLTAVAVTYALLFREPAVPQRSTLVLRVSGALAETPPEPVISQLAGAGRTMTVRAYIDDLRKAKVDARVSSVLVVPANLELPYWGKVQELRDAILDFRKSGKRAVAYLEYGGEREYYLASACDQVFLLPSSPLDLNGLASYELFLRGTLDKIGAYPDFYHIGDYKTAPNQLTEKAFTPAHREMSESLNRDLYDQLVRGIAESRKKSVADVQRLLDEGPFLPEAARQAGLVDGLAYEDQLDDKGAFGGRTFTPLEGDDYARVELRSLGLNRGPRIAVIYVVGLINGGGSGYDPVNGAVAGSDTLVEAIRTARADSAVRAIVVRIDSPGGSSTASDVIWRELVVTRDEKRSRPLVASMSDLAASGGYYVAMAASQIVAQPGTLTGSIGIYGGKIVTAGVFEKIGANMEATSIGRNAEMDSPVRPFNEAERAKFVEQLRAFYDQFVAKAATSRRMTRAQVDALGQGRVWTGQQARANGLVDALGGLDRAIALAKQRAGISADTDVEIVTYPPRRTLYDLLAQELSGGSRSGMADLASLVGVADRRAIGALTAPFRLFRRGEPLALMPLSFVD
jgi:protease IV